MEKISEIAWRLIIVAYSILFLGGLLFTSFVWTISKPYSYETYSYLVTCDNGKTFDPTSKPIDKEDYSEPYRFSVNQVKAECAYGDAFLVGWSKDIPKNYFIRKQIHTHIRNTEQDQIHDTVIFVSIYYISLEIIRRTFMFIFLGKNFLTLKPITTSKTKGGK